MTSGWEFDQRIVVVSPHLDDGVFSLGATVARAACAGTDVTMLTVMAGDLTSTEPAGWWDRSSFQTAAEAFAVRQAEDRRACGVLGARVLQMHALDDQYRGQHQIEREVIAKVVAELSGPVTVLLPGFPLQNQDHVLVTHAILASLPDDVTVGFYGEQPYIWRAGAEPDARGPEGERVAWSRVPASPAEIRRKSRAIREYRSQLRRLGSFVRSRMLFDEIRRGGEAIGWRIEL